MLCPVMAAQSASFFMSANSPTPKLSSLRREKTGMAVPAPRQVLPSKTGSVSQTAMAEPFRGTSAKKWLGPDSQALTSPVEESRMTNLNSKGASASSHMLHEGIPLQVRGKLSFQSLNRGPLPVMARVSSLRMQAAVTQNARFPAFSGTEAFLPNMTSVKALLRKGESAGRSCQQSRTSHSLKDFFPEGRIKLWPCHSRRRVLPSDSTSNEYSKPFLRAGRSTATVHMPLYMHSMGSLPPSLRTRVIVSPCRVKYSRFILMVIRQKRPPCRTQLQY